MGETGVSDHADVANVAYNPALVSLLTSADFTFGVLHDKFRYVEVETRGGILGGGHRKAINQSFTVGGGASAGYLKRKWGIGDVGGDPDAPLNWSTPESSWHFALGLMVAYRDIVQVGTGLAIKPWKFESPAFAAEGFAFDSKRETTLLDAGIDVSATLLRRAGYELSAAAGFTYYNFGDDIRETNPQPSPSLNASGWDPIEYRRYGISVVFSSPSWEKADRYLKTTLPVVSFAANYDYEIPVYPEQEEYLKRNAVGAELGFLRTLFSRVGYIDEEKDYLQDPTLGFGIAYNTGRVHARFDYARLSGGYYEDDQFNRYGFTVEYEL
jgi:hypothetical protein